MIERCLHDLSALHHQIIDVQYAQQANSISFNTQSTTIPSIIPYAVIKLIILIKIASFALHLWVQYSLHIIDDEYGKRSSRCFWSMDFLFWEFVDSGYSWYEKE